jgi:phosphate transport system substrate-binding protein
MNTISVYPIKTLRISKRTKRAVSPVIATLVLIVIAIVGAVGVGLILSSVSTSVGKQANPGQAGKASQQTLLIGGSTTVYPVTEAAKAAFENQYGVTIIDAQGGSDAGMQGVLSGALDIGAASSVGAVTNLENAVLSNSLSNVVVNPTLIGGSAVVVIENGPSANGLWTDTGAAGGQECQGVTKAALNFMFGTAGNNIYISAGACTGGAPTYSTLDSTSTGLYYTGHVLQASIPANGVECPQISEVSALSAGASVSATLGQCVLIGTGTILGDAPALSTVYTSVSRADNSGTQDQFASFTGLPKQSAAGNYPGTTETGNPGVLNYVNTHSATIGFVDLGFAEGAASGAICPSGWTAGGTTTCGVSLPQVFTSTPAHAPLQASAQSLSSGVTFAELSGGTAYAPVTTNYLAYDGFVANSHVISGAIANPSNVHAGIIAALKAAYFVNPLTGSGSKALFPDTVAGATNTGLARTFYYVTNGTPTPLEQEWLSYITNYNQESAFTTNGYFSQYDITSA